MSKQSSVTDVAAAPPVVDLTDPALFQRDEFGPVLAWLRTHAPVYRHPEPDGDGFWVLTRHRDVVDAYLRHAVLSSRYGMRLDSDPAAVAAVSQRMLIVSDEPRHGQLKRVLTRALGRAELPRIAQLVRAVVREVLDGAVKRPEFDFVTLAQQIPNQVACTLMGIPAADWAWIGQITTEAFESDAPQERSAAHGEIFLYFADLLERRRVEPGDDYVSRIANDELVTDEPPGVRPLTAEEVVFNCNGVLAGANETTRYSASGGMLAFARNPEQWQRLRTGGAEAISGAVEEILRWTTPGVHAMRVALAPITIGGTAIAPGDRVTLWNASANRDEEVFQEPDRFDIGRSSNRHVTFGHGPHICLGARLARLELTVLLEELIDRVERIELTGEPQYNSSNFTWGLRRLPVRLTPLPARTGGGLHDQRSGGGAAGDRGAGATDDRPDAPRCPVA